MAHLFQLKIQAEQDVSREELAIYQLDYSTQCEQLLLHDLTRLDKELETAKRHQAQVARAVVQASNIVSAIQGEYTTLLQADKALDKAFKFRKDLAAADAYLDVLLRLYRRRPKRYGLGVAVPPLDKEHDCPEGLDEPLWRVFVKARAQKVASEQTLHAKGEELAQAKAFLQRRQETDKSAGTAIEVLIEEKTAQQQQVQLLNLNAELLVTVKQGQVEVAHADDFDPNYGDAVLIHRSHVDDLNERVRQLAQV